jgi:exodeoxyribonuclease-3
MRLPFEICTYNCNGLGDFEKRKNVFDFLRNQKCNIYFLQETHLLHASENFIRSSWVYTVFLSGSDTNKNGVAIMFNNNFEYKLHNVIRDPGGCYILLDIEILSKRLTSVNVYGPSAGDNPAFFDVVCNHIVNIGNDLIIAAGDWNVVLDMKLDSRNYTSTVNRPNTRKKIFE